MKKLLLLSTLVLFTIAGFSQKKMFVRVFDGAGKKTHKGFLKGVTDTSLLIGRKIEGYTDTFEIPVQQIKTLKLKRSAGHTILISSLITGGVAAIIGGASADPDAWIFAYTVGEGITTGLIAGGAGGAVLGSIISGTIKKPVFTINQNMENWITAKKALQTYVPVTSR